MFNYYPQSCTLISPYNLAQLQNHNIPNHTPQNAPRNDHTLLSIVETGSTDQQPPPSPRVMYSVLQSRTYWTRMHSSSPQTDCSQRKSVLPACRSITAALRARDILTGFSELSVCLLPRVTIADDALGRSRFQGSRHKFERAVICVSQVRLLSSYGFMSCSRLDLLSKIKIPRNVLR